MATVRAPPFPFTLNRSQLDYDAAQRSVEVTLGAKESWNITSAPTWVTPSQSSGVGNATLILGLDENAALAERSGVVVITGSTAEISIHVSQLGRSDQLVFEETWENGVIDSASWNLSYTQPERLLPGLVSNEYVNGLWGYSVGWQTQDALLESVATFVPEPGMRISARLRVLVKHCVTEGNTTTCHGRLDHWRVQFHSEDAADPMPGFEVTNTTDYFTDQGMVTAPGLCDAMQFLEDGSIVYLSNGQVLYRTASGWIDYDAPSTYQLRISGGAGYAGQPGESIMDDIRISVPSP